MDQRTRATLASGFILVIFLLVQLGALALVEPFKAAGLQAVENPQDPTNSLVYVGAILVATLLMLAAIRLDVEGLIRALVVFSGAYLAWYVFGVVVPPVVTVQSFNVLALLLALGLGVALYAYPEWYVIDGAGIVMGASAAGLFGISFGLLPALLLLTVLAVYDAVSVYGTEHMLTLASGVMDLKIPIVLVVPLSLSYSYLDAETPNPTGEVDGDEGASEGTDPASGAEDDADGAAVADDAVSVAADGAVDPDAGVGAQASGIDDGPAGDRDDGTDEPDDGADDTAEAPDPMDRDALFIGLGDAVIPTVLVASAAFFAPGDVPSFGIPGIAMNLPALLAMVGTLVGLTVLLRMVLKGRAHAGLPLLNGGAIAGYLVGALASGVPLLQALGVAQFL
jgi:presenilin-like A22 family membrane protease